MSPGDGLALRGVSRRFGATWALRDASFQVPQGALCVVVGPSGCGKSTALRVVAGFESPDEGSVLLDGEDVTRTAPERRRAAMVFQHFALFPNLTVEENVAYGPRVQRVDAARRAEVVREAISLVGLGGLEARRPHELSGGQQQRVAVARAVAAEPGTLLLDEPLSNVDPALRRETRERLRAVHDARRTTTLWVTHDRDEALAVADRVVVMRAGAVEQAGAPREVCSAPATPFVAELLLDAVAFGPAEAATVLGLRTDAPVAVRPDRIALRRAPEGPLRLVAVTFGPVRTELVAEARLPASGEPFRLRAHVPTDEIPADLAPGAVLRASVATEHVIRFGR